MAAVDSTLLESRNVMSWQHDEAAAS
jgi:hypothetical protein